MFLTKLCILFYLQKNQPDFQRIKSAPGSVEYIPLNNPVVNVQWIRIKPLVLVLEAASFKLDIVTCDNSPGKPLFVISRLAKLQLS